MLSFNLKFSTTCFFKLNITYFSRLLNTWIPMRNNTWSSILWLNTTKFTVGRRRTLSFIAMIVMGGSSLPSDGTGDRELDTIGELTSNLQKQLNNIKCTALFGICVMTGWDFKKGPHQQTYFFIPSPLFGISSPKSLKRKLVTFTRVPSEITQNTCKNMHLPRPQWPAWK